MTECRKKYNTKRQTQSATRSNFSIFLFWQAASRRWCVWVCECVGNVWSWPWTRLTHWLLFNVGLLVTSAVLITCSHRDSLWNRAHDKHSAPRCLITALLSTLWCLPKHSANIFFDMWEKQECSAAVVYCFLSNINTAASHCRYGLSSSFAATRRQQILEGATCNIQLIRVQDK